MAFNCAERLIHILLNKDAAMEEEMKLGIVGLPNVGKSTLFNSLTKAGAEVANYPFCTIDPNVGVVPVPDNRLKVLTDLYSSKSTIPAVVEFVDIAGLVKGASKGEGLGNQFLANIRECDAIVHVVRCFEDSNIIHVEGSVNPIRDIETINLELILSDLDIIDKRYAKAKKGEKNDKALAKESKLLEKLKELLEAGHSAREFTPDDEEEEAIIHEMGLLTGKPVIYAANVKEDVLSDDGESDDKVKSVREFAKKEGSGVFVICAQIEQEIAELSDDEKKDYLDALGIKESGLQKLIEASYSLLGLISFLTAGEKETRAWTITRGTKAPQAAGKIHSDFERGFIRAEVVAYDDLIKCGGFNQAKEKGLVRSEGKDYVMQDGDVVLFRFNV
jgi:ribosome-binding ATPase